MVALEGAVAEGGQEAAVVEVAAVAAAVTAVTAVAAVAEVRVVSVAAVRGEMRDDEKDVNGAV